MIPDLYTFWTFIQVLAAPPTLHIARSVPQQQEFKLSLTVIRVDDGVTPEQAAVGNGLFPFAYCRPSLPMEITTYFEAHPDQAPATVPDVFTQA